MKVNLRTARKIDTKLMNFISEQPDTSEHLNKFNEYNVADTLDQVQTRLHSEVAAHIKAIETRSTIRRYIQIANEQSGINQLISDRKQVVSVGAFASCLVENARHSQRGSTEMNETILAGKLDEARNIVSPGSSYSSSDIVTISAMSNETLTRLNEIVRESVKSQETFDEEILSLNVGTTIQLDADTVEFLRGLGIV